ncbi:membrane integrity-associated transporter subunit PqiC [Pseudoalteromonas fenneropenaei]|uniref:Membrane integrity-associated transporter subunit PqiC n=1 Tax=Pseudoalteromonas fenneropenaei TaxID=1737459 RepID=A0ABV7CME8_9GAMM
MKMILMSVVTASLLGSIVGCSPTQVTASHYYQFNPPVNEKLLDVTSAPVVLLRKVKIQGVSQSQALVQQLQNGETHIANYHFWSAPLNELVDQYLLASLQSSTTAATILPEAKWLGRYKEASWFIDIEINQMVGTANEQAVLSGHSYYYQLSGNELQLKSSHAFNHQTTLTGIGFNALVAAHQSNLDSFATQLISQLDGLQQGQ